MFMSPHPNNPRGGGILVLVWIPSASVLASVQLYFSVLSSEPVNES